jgi:uncharacterized repeat protein (TIGR01451 family)
MFQNYITFTLTLSNNTRNTLLNVKKYDLLVIGLSKTKEQDK